MMIGLLAVWGQVRKELLIAWTYKTNQLINIAALGCMFVGIGLMMGDGELDPSELAPMFLGYMTWFYALSAIMELSSGLRGEMSAGTLEQMSMSPAPIGLVMLGRVIANLILSTAHILIQAVVLFLLLDIHLPMRWEGIPVLLLTLVGVFGFGFIVAGATLVFKQVESVANLIQNMLLFLNGTILPVENMPDWLAGIARTLPSTQGIVVIRRVVLGGQSLSAVWQDGSLIWLIVHSAIYFAIGWVVFTCCERVAKKQGSLGQY